MTASVLPLTILPPLPEKVPSLFFLSIVQDIVAAHVSARLKQWSGPEAAISSPALFLKSSSDSALTALAKQRP